jgi:hypothetical protein
MKMYGEVKVELHAFLTSAVGGASRPGRFTLREGAPFPLDRRLGEAQTRSGRWGKEKYILPLRRLARSLVPTEPPRIPTVR